MSANSETILVTSPLEEEHVSRIREAAPEGVTVVCDQDLLPDTRYVADHKGVDTFTRTAEQEERFAAHLRRATILWDFPASGLADAPNVRWVQTTSSGVGQLVSKLKLADHPVVISTARGVHAGPLAEFAMMALLIHAKRLDYLRAEQKAHRWERYCGTDLRGRVMAVVGAGRVGAEVGRLAKAFGMHVLSVVNRPSPERAAELHADEVMGPDRLVDAVSRADCVTLCAPHTSDTENMIDAGVIARMKPGVVFVNIGRGQLVDEEALIEALRDDRIGFAALDVARMEPLPKDSPLWDMPNVLISPHSASTVESENEKIVDIFIENLRHFVAGEPDRMINVFDKTRMY
ncbi:D-2-hydroxyacid dehydrogenase [Roseitranquillus sediminis]|uniref:D-2-hydroxyacid dehydrogenase n=1 Tax=Roseitranquillus sediminis TaxID=2809051 RepID=UPI001D0C638A|nr:D-2-hydroxyacid dehydrogenase [Roseitranquillus sediminis]MBM9593028.1 D-2-hydroxyacid dehydrogenase [Roseitranquillus sediminis]